MAQSNRAEIVIQATPEAVAQEGARRFARLAQESIASRGAFSVALSGGSTPRLLYKKLASLPVQGAIDWGKVHLFWGDERFVPLDDPESNFHSTQTGLLSQVPVPKSNVYPVPTSGVTPAQAAELYSQYLANFFSKPLPRFDLILLGLGPDGHTASLFPGQMDDPNPGNAAVAVVENAPKPPPLRLSLSLASINQAAHILFLVTGSDKAAIVRRVLQPDDGEALLPAQRVQPSDGAVVWLLDQAAAQDLDR
ncbi:MAG: 6-phosphogluconolactonase [Caldilineaceae bacterium]|nr:6-phosphogluconolactonase [Caldilineaceae bacterium]